MNNKAVLYFICASFLVSLCFPLSSVVTAQSTTLSINPETYEVAENEIGTTFTVDIDVTDVSGLWGWKTALSWNSEVLNLTDIEEGPFLKDVATTFFISDSDWENIAQGYIPEIICSFLSVDTVDGNGVLATLTFEAMDAGDCEIELSETILMEPETGHPEISHTVNNGNVTVIPEFQSWMFLPVLVVTTIIVVFLKSRHFQ